ncbi:MAG: hypothetical protein KGZ67_04660 [Hydrogenophaga sp.]|jgi:hypothetical protein|nr:hypothetical protein [Hydrogenophaga sp.]
MEQQHTPVHLVDTAPSLPTPAAQGFDLDSVQDAGMAEYEVTHPVTGAGTGAIFLLAGPEHPERKRITLSLIRRMRADAMRAQGKGKATDPEADIEEGRDMLVKATLGWRGVCKAGQPVPFSPQAAAQLYADPKTQWLTKQLLAAMNDQDLFIKA